MKLPTSPCYKCEDRHIGCHSDCGKYLDFQVAVSAYHKKITDERVENRRMNDIQWLVYHKHHHGTQRPK